MLIRLRDQGKTIFLNSHLLSEVECVCDRVAILLAGKVVRQGTLDELTAGSKHFEIQLHGEAEQRHAPGDAGVAALRVGRLCDDRFRGSGRPERGPAQRNQERCPRASRSSLRAARCGSLPAIRCGFSP